LWRKHLKKHKTNIIIGGDIRVNTIGRNSGIFIGERNVAIGWSAHGKSNSVFGSIGDSNLVSNNFSLLIDPDLIDTPIDDRDQHIFFEKAGRQEEKTNIDINALNVTSIAQNAGIFIGEGKINGMESHEKENSAMGSISGEKNLSINNVNLNNDPDIIDAIINDQDNKTTLINGNYSELR
jgi:hypothetical protein